MSAVHPMAQRGPASRVLALGLAALVALLAALSFAAAPVAASGVTVTITYRGFAPEQVTIQPGQSVTWVNHDPPIVHGVVPLRGGFYGSSAIKPGKSLTVYFPSSGVFPYRDSYNWNDIGVVIVKGAYVAPAPKPAPQATPKPAAQATPKPTATATAKPTAWTSPRKSARAVCARPSGKVVCRCRNDHYGRRSVRPCSQGSQMILPGASQVGFCVRSRSAPAESSTSVAPPLLADPCRAGSK